MTNSGHEKSFFIQPLPPIRSPIPKLSPLGQQLWDSMKSDIQQLNHLITDYNRANDRSEKIAKLKQLDETRQRLDDQYADNAIAFFPDYQAVIYTSLQHAMQQQRAYLHIGSNYQGRAIFEPDSGQELSDVIHDMETADIAQIMQILAAGKRKNIHQRLAQIAPTNQAYQNFLMQHDVEYVGGGNSQNFAFVNRIRQQRILLKLENRLDNPKKDDRELRAALSGPGKKASFLVHEWSDRRAAYEDLKTGTVTVRRLTVMDFSRGRALDDLPIQADVAAQQTLAVDAALAQIIVYKKMHLLGKAWTDGKGANLLLHRDPSTQCMVAEIADCKGIYACDLDQETATFEEAVCTTSGISAPELIVEKPGVIDMDKSAVYTIGKNLYETLLRFAPKAYQKYLTPSSGGDCPYEQVELPDNYFNHPIFAEPFKALIQSMIQAVPAARISNDELFLQLLDIKFAQHPDRAQYQQIGQKIKQILAFDLPVEEKQQRAEFTLKCYQALLEPQQDLNNLEQRLNRVIQKYEARPSTIIYKEALDNQKKDGEQKSEGLDSSDTLS